jgi:hypothetical protein
MKVIQIPVVSGWRKVSPMRKEGGCEMADGKNELSTPLEIEVYTLFVALSPPLWSLGMLPSELHSAGREK